MPLALGNAPVTDYLQYFPLFFLLRLHYLRPLLAGSLCCWRIITFMLIFDVSFKASNKSTKSREYAKVYSFINIKIMGAARCQAGPGNTVPNPASFVAVRPPETICNR